MKHLFCLFGRHEWHPMSWGHQDHLSAQECGRCGKFQIWAMWQWVNATRQNFPDAKRIEIPDIKW